MEWDVFISHASQDKESVARPLTAMLRKSGLKVWFDERELVLGDRLWLTINRALAQSRFGVVLISRAFLMKTWPKWELEGMVALEESGRKMILPVRHELSHEELTRVLPLLAARLTISTSEGLESVAHKLVAAVRPMSADPAEDRARAVARFAVAACGSPRDLLDLAESYFARSQLREAIAVFELLSNMSLEESTDLFLLAHKRIAEIQRRMSG